MISKDVVTTMASAQECRRRGQMLQAEAFAREALAIQPDCVEALALLGRLCLESERFSEAIDLLRRVVAMHSRDVDGWITLGVACERAGDVERAISCYERAATLQPKMPDPHYALGSAHYAAGDYVAAEKHARCVFEACPDRLDAAVNLVRCLQAQDQHAEALEIAHAALQKHPTNGDLLELLARSRHVLTEQ